MPAQLPAIRELKPGELLIEQGEPAMEAYLIMDGMAEVFLTRDGKDTKVADVREGDIVGEAALFKGSDYGASVRAASELIVQPITPEILDDKIKGCDPMLKALIRMLMIRLRKTNEALGKAKD